MSRVVKTVKDNENNDAKKKDMPIKPVIEDIFKPKIDQEIADKSMKNVQEFFKIFLSIDYNRISSG